MCHILVPRLEALCRTSDARRRALRDMKPLMVTKTAQGSNIQPLPPYHWPPYTPAAYPGLQTRIEQVSPTVDILFFSTFTSYVHSCVAFHDALPEFERIVITFDFWDAVLFNIGHFDEVMMLFRNLRSFVVVYDPVGLISFLDDPKEFKLFPFTEDFKKFVLKNKPEGDVDSQTEASFRPCFARHLEAVKYAERKFRGLQQRSAQAPSNLEIKVQGIARERIQFPGEYVHRWGPKYCFPNPRLYEDNMQAYVKDFLGA